MPNNQHQAALEHLPQAIVFEAVIRTGSFGAAAKELGLARSTVSQRVAALEEALGVRLLHRTTRSMSLTEAGQALLSEMAPILSDWRSAETQLRSYSTDPKGLVVITAPDMLMSEFVVPTTKRVRSRFPKLQFELRATTTTLPLLDEGIDIALRAGPLPASGHGAVLWWRGSHIALGAPELSEQFPATIPSDLQDAPWLDLKGRRPMAYWTTPSGESLPFQINPSILTDSLQVFTNLLVSGAGVGILPEVLARPFVNAGSLVRLLAPWQTDEVSFHVVTTSPNRLSAAVRFFVKELRASCQIPAPKGHGQRT